MPLDRFMIAPINGGLDTSLRPWLITDDSFSQMNNMYIFRGRFRKRFGSRYMNSTVAQSVAQLYSRVCIDIGNTEGPLNIPGSGLAIGQMFSVGNDMFTVYQLGTNVLTLSTNAGATATINSNATPNTVTFTGYGSPTAVYYYPATPIMGIIVYETQVSTADPTYIFDIQFAYQFTGGKFQRLGTAVWTGSDSQFFWGTTWGQDTTTRNLFVVNNNVADEIKYWNGSAGSPAWYNFAPPVLANSTTNVFITLETALIVVVFKNRLVALNTTENVNTFTNPSSTNSSGAGSGTVSGGSGAVGNYFYIGNQQFTVVSTGSAALQVSGGGPTGASGTFNTSTGAYTFTGVQPSAPIYFIAAAGTNNTYTNRARWASFGDPLQYEGWRQDVPGFGNALDAGTMEDIVSCGFIKDRLIVFFERSTWELVFTGNQAQPFTWQKLNTELGAESIFSTVPFDKVLLTVGNVGIHACNGVNVQRIDDKIPDTVWQVHDGATEVNRIYGIRDYYTEQVYWTFPSTSTNPFSSTYPNKILVYNYKTGSWAFNDDSITAFGYYYAASQSSINWSSTNTFWNSNEVAWNSGTAQPLNQEILAGNQEGFVFIIDAGQAQNAPALQITQLSLNVLEGYTDSSGNLSGTVAGGSGAIGNYFYVGGQIFTVTASSGAMTVSGTGPGGAAGTFNTSTGAYTITGSNPLAQVFYYSAKGTNVVLTVINHNLNVGDYIYVQFLNGLTGPFLSLYQVDLVIDSNTIIMIAPDVLGVLQTGATYTGGGTIARLSQINILTKQFNFYVDQDRNATVQRVDFLVDRTTSGEFTVDFLTSTTNQPLLEPAQENGTLLGTGIVETSPYALYPSEAQQDRLWHPTYLFAEGNAVQLNIYLSPEEMTNFSVVTAPLTIHAMTFYCQPTRSRAE